ncbi:YrbL family protein [Yoonia sp.]|uniref:YrbL family protein n=1 Tax=Yoonia sp. TaxID=2212373 RepID=UPI002FD98BFA
MIADRLVQEQAPDPKLHIDPADCLASGTQREVYRHPDDPTRLIKLLRKMPEAQGRSRMATTGERLFPNLRRRWVRKEYQEYLRMMLRPDSDKIRPPITHMYGFVATTLGLGCLCDAVLDGHGNLGSTLEKKTGDGSLTATDLGLFNDTIRRLYLYDVRVGDMTARNFVFGQRVIGGHKGPRECVLVDGFGDIHAIPIRSWGRMFNRLGLDDSCKRLARKTGLQWSSDTKLFYRAR